MKYCENFLTILSPRSSCVNGKYTDVTIKCKNQETYRCHRIILASRCKFFAVCFDKGFKEGDDAVISMEDDDPLAIFGMITFLYTGSTAFVDEAAIDMRSHNKEREYIQYLVCLYLVADKYELPLLAEDAALRLENEVPKKDGIAWTRDPRALMKGMSLLYEGAPLHKRETNELREALAARALHSLAEWKTRFFWDVRAGKDDGQKKYTRDLDKLISKNPEIARDLLASLAVQYEEVVEERDSLKEDRDKLSSEHELLTSQHEEVVKERDGWKRKRDMLFAEWKALTSQNEEVVEERDDLQKERDRLSHERGILLKVFQAASGPRWLEICDSLSRT